MPRVSEYMRTALPTVACESKKPLMGTFGFPELALLLGVSLLGCRPSGGAADVPRPEEGMHAFPSPRTFDAPGTVYRIRAGGVRTLVLTQADLPTLAIDTAAEHIAVRTAMTRGSVSPMAAFLGVRMIADAARRDTVRMSVSGAKREFTTERRLRAALATALDSADFAGPGQLYVILETVLADSVDIVFSGSRSFVVARGDSGTARADSAGMVTWRATGSSTLQVRFPRPYRVFYKALAVSPGGKFLEPGADRTVVLLPAQGEEATWIDP